MFRLIQEVLQAHHTTDQSELMIMDRAVLDQVVLIVPQVVVPEEIAAEQIVLEAAQVRQELQKINT